MQQPSGRTQAQESSPSARDPGFLSPLKVFVGLLIVLAVLVIAAVLLIDSKDENGQAASGSEQTQATGPTGRKLSPTLTDEEAIAKFRELNAVAIRAARNRDTALLSLVFTPSGKTAARARAAIQELKRDGVYDESEIQTVSTRVISNTQSSVTLREVTRVLPCFKNEAGEDVTEAPSHVQRVAQWVLVRAREQWRLSEARIIRQREIGRGRAHC